MNWRREDKELAKIWDATLDARRETMNEHSGRIIEKALTGETRLRPMEQINVAFRVKEAYDPAFQKTSKVEVTSNSLNINVSMSKEELQNRIMELSTKLGYINNQTENDNSTGVYADAEYTEEPSTSGKE